MAAVAPSILVVDDQSSTIFLARMMLERAGYRVTEARVASDAIAAIQHHQFDALLLDLYLADQSAIEVLNQCPIRPATVLMTGASMDVSADTLSEMRIVDIVRKPFSYSVLVDAIERAVKRVRSRESTELSVDYLDVQHLADIRNVADSNSYDVFVSEALSNAGQLAAQLAAASTSLNSLGWFEHLQTLSGIASTLGARALKQAVDEALTVKLADVPKQAKHHEARITTLIEGTAKRLASSNQLLSERERDCLRLVAKGNSAGVIAETLGITTHTVEFHIRKAGTKLGTKGRTSTVAKAMELGAL
jgi:DNA-binding NarL/FixJ family response regulator